MISPFTKPGTKVVCIATGTQRVCRNAVLPLLSAFRVGEVYTVREINCEELSPTGFVARLDEFDFYEGFGTHLLRPAELPKSITELLNVSPVDSELVGL